MCIYINTEYWLGYSFNDFPATTSDLNVTLLDMKLSPVKRFFEEKPWLLIKKE